MSPLLGIAAVNSLLFTAYGASRRLVSPYPDLSVGQVATAGAMAGAANAILASPVSCPLRYIFWLYFIFHLPPISSMAGHGFRSVPHRRPHLPENRSSRRMKGGNIKPSFKPLERGEEGGFRGARVLDCEAGEMRRSK